MQLRKVFAAGEARHLSACGRDKRFQQLSRAFHEAKISETASEGICFSTLQPPEYVEPGVQPVTPFIVFEPQMPAQSQ